MALAGLSCCWVHRRFCKPNEICWISCLLFFFLFFLLCNSLRTPGPPLALQASLVAGELGWWQRDVVCRGLRQTQCNESSSLHAVCSPLSKSGTTKEWKTPTRDAGVHCLYRAVLQGSPPAFSASAAPFLAFCIFSVLFSISFLSALLFFVLLRCSSGFFYLIDAHLLSALYRSVPQASPIR